MTGAEREVGTGSSYADAAEQNPRAASFFCEPDITMIPPTFINTYEQFEAMCARWLTLDAIGLDTEFERTRTYYSRPALLQIFDGDAICLIDPLSIDDFSPLAEVLQRPGIIKVMHASEGDNEILEQLSGIEPRPIFDTQLAAAFAGYGYSLGYRALVKLLLELDLAKQETRSDWLRRPLSEAQIAYAALDVAHLLPMYERLQRELAELGRGGWLREETERLQQRRATDRDPCRAYLRIRHTRRMGPSQLALLRELAAWRETEARERNLPRQMIVKDASLVAIAESAPASAAQLSDIPELSENALRRYAQALLAAVGRAESHQPPPRPSPVMERRCLPWLKALKRLVGRTAEHLNMPAPLLVQTRTLEALVSGRAHGEQAIPEELRGWREEVIGTALMTELRRLAGA